LALFFGACGQSRFHVWLLIHGGTHHSITRSWVFARGSSNGQGFEHVHPQTTPGCALSH